MVSTPVLIAAAMWLRSVVVRVAATGWAGSSFKVTSYGMTSSLSRSRSRNASIRRCSASRASSRSRCTARRLATGSPPPSASSAPISSSGMSTDRRTRMASAWLAWAGR
jgi:hypothetical protein